MRKSKADAVTGGVLAENQVKIDNADKAIKAALERKHKIIMENKLYIYGQLAELYGKEGQELLDAVIVEHTLIGKLTASGMTYDQIAELADDSSAVAVNDADDAEDDDADSDHGNDVSEYQTSFFDGNHSD